MHMRMAHCIGALAGLLIVVPGCGDGAKMASVSGHVMCNGRPVAAAAITFSPMPQSGDIRPGKPATGFTDDDGRYELSTFKSLDGALVGSHRVRIVLDDTNPAKCKREKVIERQVNQGRNDIDIELNE